MNGIRFCSYRGSVFGPLGVQNDPLLMRLFNGLTCFQGRIERAHGLRGQGGELVGKPCEVFEGVEAGDLREQASALAVELLPVGAPYALLGSGLEQLRETVTSDRGAFAGGLLLPVQGLALVADGLDLGIAHGKRRQVEAEAVLEHDATLAIAPAVAVAIGTFPHADQSQFQGAPERRLEAGRRRTEVFAQQAIADPYDGACSRLPVLRLRPGEQAIEKGDHRPGDVHGALRLLHRVEQGGGRFDAVRQAGEALGMLALLPGGQRQLAGAAVPGSRGWHRIERSDERFRVCE